MDRKQERESKQIVTVPMYGTTYGNWKGWTGPGKQLSDMLSDGNNKLRPGYSKALSKAYAEYCESDEAPKGPGPCTIRAAKYAELAEQLKEKYSGG